jgi:hypothetical protein
MVKVGKRIVTSVFVTVLVSSISLANLAEAGTSISPDIPFLGMELRENSELGRMPTVLFGKTNPNVQNTWYVCSDLDDKICTDSPGVAGTVDWDVCTESSTLACIAEIWAVDPSGVRIPGQFSKSVPENSKYAVAENPSINMPASNGLGGVWRIPGVVNSAGRDTYFVAVQSALNVDKPVGVSVRNSKLNMYELIAGILPVEEVPGTFQLRRAVDAREPGQASSGSTGSQYAPDGSICIAAGTSYCEAIRDFPKGYRFGMTLRMGKKLDGWYHGRLQLPNIRTKEWKTGQEISIEADPVRVGSLDFMVPASEIPEAVKKLVFTGKDIGQGGMANGGVKISENLSGPLALELVSAFAPAYKDKATATSTYWSFRTLNYGANDDVQRCSDNSGNLAGFVTTNSLAYAAGPPVFDKGSGILNYKVASPHFEANGEIATGTYDLTLRSDVARCVYGFSKAPIQAEISITSQDGEKKVATTIVNEKDGWLYLSAKGFTFSSPTINVKLSQEKVAAPTPSATPVATVTVAKKSVAITCVKGKTTKKVSGASHKCPTGYKKE